MQHVKRKLSISVKLIRKKSSPVFSKIDKSVLFLDLGTLVAHAGNLYEPVPQTSNEIEDENDRMTNELRDKIGVLKSLSIDIGNEVRYQDKLLRDVDDDMDRTRGFLGNTMNRVLRLSKGSHNYYIVYLFFFSLFVFFVLYIILKFR